MSVSSKKTRAKYRAAGLCYRCGLPVSVGLASCDLCREKEISRGYGAREISWESWIRAKTNHARSWAKKGGFGFSITPEYVMSVLVKQDYRCNILKSLLLEHVGKSPVSMSIDRIDSNKGYVEGNIQLVSLFANLGKRSFSQEIIEKKIINRVSI